MMKISTKRIPVQEMAIQAPTELDLQVMKECIPSPQNFPYPTPDGVLAAYYNSPNRYKASASLQQFLTGKKLKGSGTALASYRTLYNHAIVPLQTMWGMRNSPDDVISWLLENPIEYKRDKDPRNAQDPETGTVDVRLWAANCFTNLMEWIYLISTPAYQYIREQLLEKARYLRKLIATNSGIRGITRVLPQRTTTSRSLGENETTLFRINAGYRFTEVEDVYTRETMMILELVTWFFTDSKTKRHMFKDYFDVEAGNTQKAINEMKKSELYRGWAMSMSPKQYDAACNPFRIEPTDMDKEISGLTILTGEL